MPFRSSTPSFDRTNPPSIWPSRIGKLHLFESMVLPASEYGPWRSGERRKSAFVESQSCADNGNEGSDGRQLIKSTATSSGPFQRMPSDSVGFVLSAGTAITGTCIRRLLNDASRSYKEADYDRRRRDWDVRKYWWATSAAAISPSASILSNIVTSSGFANHCSKKTHG